MSRSHITKSQQPLPQIKRWQIVLPPAILIALFLAVILAFNWIRSFSPMYRTAPGKVLEIRKVVDGISDSKYGSGVYYRLEAHVEFLLDGQPQDRWMRASGDIPREALDTKLAAHPAACLVYWSPDHPENARCSLK